MPRPFINLIPRRTGVRSITFLAAMTVLALSSFSQSAPTASAQQPAPAPAPQDSNKRLLWLIPNNRSSPTLANYKPLTVREKFAIGAKDSFDRGAIVLALAFAGKGQSSNANPSFGQGAAGFGKYFGTSYGDVIIGNMMTDSIYPSLLHQDPRYFRRGTGSTWSRLGYAMGQIFVTHSDSGHRQFNYSEIAGNATAVAISMSYYPDSRDASSAAGKFGIQVGIDMAGNILREFCPDISRKLSHQPKPAAPNH